MTAQTTDAPESMDSSDVRVDDSAGPEAEGVTDVGADEEPTDAKSPSDVRADDSVGPESEDSSDVGADEEPTDGKSPRRRVSISFSVRGLVIAVVIAILAGGMGTFAWLYIGARGRLDAQASESANDARAEKIALDYAVNAATMDFKDLKGWAAKLVAGTSQKLNDKLTEAAKSIDQILVPLQWSSTAQPLVAKVRSRTGGIIIVDCFVSVQTKTVQAPEALQSTATYGLTIDTNDNWAITDVGGVGAVVGLG